jgi:hypothetical protein
MQVVGVRGSGQMAGDAGGFGTTVRAVVDEIRRINPTVAAAPINYQAIPIKWWDPTSYGIRYADSVNTGKEALVTYIRNFVNSSCGKITFLYLIGYSQGAQVVGDVYENYGSKLTSKERKSRLYEEEHKRIAGIAMIADPKFKGSQRGPVNVGSYNRKWNGAQAITVGPRTVGDRQQPYVRSYCVAGDPACNYSANNAARCAPPGSRCVHSRYMEITRPESGLAYTAEAANYLLARWRQKGPKPPEGGPTGPPRRWSVVSGYQDSLWTSPIGDAWISSYIQPNVNSTRLFRYRPDGMLAGSVIDLPLHLQSLGFAPNGTGYAIGYSDPPPPMVISERLVRIEATGNWRTVATWNYPSLPSGTSSVRIGPNGELYVYGPGILRVLDPTSGAELESISVPSVLYPTLAPRPSALHSFFLAENFGEVRPYSALAAPVTLQPSADVGMPRPDVSDDGSLLLAGDDGRDDTQVCSTGHIVNFTSGGSIRYIVPWRSVAGSFTRSCNPYGGAALSHGRSVVGYELDDQVYLAWINSAGHVEARTALPTETGWEANRRGDLMATAGDGVAVAFTETNACDLDNAFSKCAKVKIYAATRSGIVDRQELQGDGAPGSPHRFIMLTHPHLPQQPGLQVGTGYVLLNATYQSFDCGLWCTTYGAKHAHVLIPLSVEQRKYQGLL